MVQRLAQEIQRDHPPDEPLILVAAMKGAICFCADLMRKLSLPLELELLQPSSYHGTERGELALAGRLDAHRIAGERVLLIDTVLDSGATLGALHRHVRGRGPGGLATCVLVSKRVPRQEPVQVDYVGMEIDDEFIVGYGLDYDNRYRHLPYIAVLPPREQPGEQQ
jgi:hypoxanthine phosphoribosyltransferase